MSLEGAGTGPPGAASRLTRLWAGGGAAVRGALAGFGLEGGRERKAGGGLPRRNCRETPGTDQEEPLAKTPQKPPEGTAEPKLPREPPAEAAKPSESFLAKPFFQKRRE